MEEKEKKEILREIYKISPHFTHVMDEVFRIVFYDSNISTGVYVHLEDLKVLETQIEKAKEEYYNAQRRGLKNEEDQDSRKEEENHE